VARGYLATKASQNTTADFKTGARKKQETFSRLWITILHVKYFIIITNFHPPFEPSPS
jgi:hypothetical protein